MAAWDESFRRQRALAVACAGDASAASRQSRRLEHPATASPLALFKKKSPYAHLPLPLQVAIKRLEARLDKAAAAAAARGGDEGCLASVAGLGAMGRAPALQVGWWKGQKKG